MTTILHTADVHLDRTYSGAGMSPAIAGARRQELRDAFRRFIDLALDLPADAVTIGGDLYEHERATPDTGNFLRAQLARLGDIPALIAPGNHDPYVPGSLYHRLDWPANVTVFRSPEFSPVGLPGLTVWGAAHDAPDLRTGLLDGFHVRGDGPHVLLFHGSDMHAVPEGKAAHAPFFPGDITATGADFALLGHYHASRLYPAEAPTFVYPGTPEPLDFAEAGDHFIARLDIDAGGGIACRLLPFGLVRYQVASVDVSGMESSDDLRLAITALGDPTLIARVVLQGDLNADVDLAVADLYNACAERFAYLDIHDRTRPAYRLDELAEESTTKGAFVRLMRARIEEVSGTDREIAEAALLYGLQAFDRREVHVP